MEKERRHYEREFKKMTVDLLTSGKTTKEVATDLGIAPDLIRRWKREFTSNQTGCFSGNGNPNLTPEQKEIIQLKKELRDSKIEAEILKKAVSIFSRSDGKSLSL